MTYSDKDARQKVFDRLKAISRSHFDQDSAQAFGAALLEFERTVVEKAESESRRAKAMYEEGLLAVRAATAKVVEGYIEQVAALNIEIRQLREAAERARPDPVTHK